MNIPKTHDYTKRYWGHDFSIREVTDDGMKLSLVGWGDRIRKGDFLILPNDGGSTRYMVDTISYYNDPPDMWSITATFAPRVDP